MSVVDDDKLFAEQGGNVINIRKLKTVALTVFAAYFSQSAVAQVRDECPYIIYCPAFSVPLIVCHEGRSDFGCSGASRESTHLSDMLLDGDSYRAASELGQVRGEGTSGSLLGGAVLWRYGRDQKPLSQLK